MLERDIVRADLFLLGYLNNKTYAMVDAVKPFDQVYMHLLHDLGMKIPDLMKRCHNSSIVFRPDEGNQHCMRPGILFPAFSNKHYLNIYWTGDRLIKKDWKYIIDFYISYSDSRMFLLYAPVNADAVPIKVHQFIWNEVYTEDFDFEPAINKLVEVMKEYKEL